MFKNNKKMQDNKIESMNIFQAVKNCTEYKTYDIESLFKRIIQCRKEGQILKDNEIAEFKKSADRLDAMGRNEYEAGDISWAYETGAKEENLRNGLKLATDDPIPETIPKKSQYQ